MGVSPGLTGPCDAQDGVDLWVRQLHVLDVAAHAVAAVAENLDAEDGEGRCGGG